VAHANYYITICEFEAYTPGGSLTGECVDNDDIVNSLLDGETCQSAAQILANAGMNCNDDLTAFGAPGLTGAQLCPVTCQVCDPDDGGNGGDGSDLDGLFLTDGTPRNYADSVAFCEAQGMTIASIHSQEENDAVFALLTTTSYLGANEDSNGVWSWDDGTEWDYVNPQNDGLSSNAESNLAFADYDGNWHDWNNGESELGVVCRASGGGSGGCGGFLENGGFDVDSANGYTYMTPSGWSSGGNTIVVASENQPWGGLASASGANFLSIQGAGSYVEQTISVTSGTSYEIRFFATHRPGYGNDEEGIVTVDGEVVFDYPNPMPDDFTEMTATFVATSSTATIRFENDSPDGDKSIFLDDVTVCGGGGSSDAATVSCGNPANNNCEDNYCAPVDELHEVRCCSDSQIDGYQQRNGCEVWAESIFSTQDGDGCVHDSPYSTALAVCAEEGARLCTVDELEAACTQGTGCGHDADFIWTGESCGDEGGECIGVYDATTADADGPTATQDHSGWTGDGHMDFQGSHDTLTWTVSGCDGDATYTASVRYALASGDRPKDVFVNGELIYESLSFPATGGWSTWGEVTFDVDLADGTNTITIAGTGSSGGNVDSLEISGGFSGNCSADLDGSGNVGFGDLLEVLSNWGGC